MSKSVEPVLREVISGNAAAHVPPPIPSAVAHILAMPELDPTPAAQRAVAVNRAAALGDLHHALRSVKAKLTVCVGAAEVTVGELLNAQEQQVLRLDRTVEQPVDVLLDGQVVARGTLVAVDDCFAVRITELPTRVAVPLASPGNS